MRIQDSVHCYLRDLKDKNCETDSYELKTIQGSQRLTYKGPNINKN